MKRFLAVTLLQCISIIKRSVDMIDSGIYSLNYYDYPDDDIAIQREYEIGD